MSDFKSFKWITSDIDETGKSITVHNVGQVFNPVSKNPCNLISIFGRARQGKSFLMNCLAGERDIFRISNEKESCTQGIDISNKWLNLNDFSRIDGGKSTTPKLADLKVGFVDAEGQGDKDISYDANLICPILLASKCVIFNWKGDLQKDHILSTLGIMTRAAKNVSMDTSSSTSSAATTSTAPTRKKFGHLHIIFRDWQSVNSDEASTFQALFGIENTVEASTRDQIRVDVMEAFESIRVWLFDAPSDYVADLKKKLTFDKTSLVFRGQLRTLRNALSTQLREPTVLFGDQPLVGKSFGPMIRLVAESLNRGEVVLPSSAYLSMMRMEIDKIKSDYEIELRESVEHLLNEIDEICSSTGTATVKSEMTTPALAAKIAPTLLKKNNIYPTEDKALGLLNDLFLRIGNKYNEEIERSIGSATSSIADQLLATIPVQIGRINDGMRDQFLSSYHNRFTKWLLNARRKAQAYLTDNIRGYIVATTQPQKEADVTAYLEKTLENAIQMVGGTAVYGTTQAAVVDSEDVLKTHFTPLSAETHKHNAVLLAAARQTLTKHLTEVTAAMDSTISEAVTRLNATERSGYALKTLETVLNNRYFELRDHLVAKCKQSPFTEDIVNEFKQACGEMRGSMEVEYNASKAAATGAAIDIAQKTAEQRMTSVCNVEFDSSIHCEDWLREKFDDIITTVEASTLKSVSGWKASDASLAAAETEEFSANLRVALDAKAFQIASEIVPQWEQFLIEEQEEQAAAEAAAQAAAEEEAARAEADRLAEEEAAAAAAEAAAELEQQRLDAESAEMSTCVDEEDDEDEGGDYGAFDKSKVNLKRNVVTAAAKEQRERAQAWAAGTLGIKPSARRGASSTSAAAAKAAKAAPPAKSVEQQRADAAEFAKRTYGEQILEKSPAKGTAKATAGNKRKASTATAAATSSAAAHDDEQDDEEEDEDEEEVSVTSTSASSAPPSAASKFASSASFVKKTNAKKRKLSSPITSTKASTAACASTGSVPVVSGLMGSVRNWFGGGGSATTSTAAPADDVDDDDYEDEDEPAPVTSAAGKKGTPKKAASYTASESKTATTPVTKKERNTTAKTASPAAASSSNSSSSAAAPAAKPLNALQQAKLDARKAEEARVEAMLEAKKAKGKGKK